MSYLNQGYAVTLPSQTPSTYQVYQDIMRRNDMYRAKKEQDEKDEESRQNMLTKYVGDNFDGSNFDGLLGQQLANKRAQYARYIHDNPSTSMSDLSMMMQNDLGKLSQYSNQIRMGRDQIKSEAGAFKDYKGIDYGAAENAALRNYLYKQDQHGQYTLKSPDELGDASGIVKKQIYDHPDLFLTKEANPYEDLKSTDVAQAGDAYTFVNAHKGAEKRKYDFEYYPAYQKVVHEAGKDPVIAPRSQPMTWPDGSPMMDDNKKPVMGVDDVAWQKYLSNPVRELNLRKKFAQKYGSTLAPDSPAGQAFMKQLALEDISNIAPKKHDIQRYDKQNPIVINNGAGGASANDWMDSPAKYLVGAANGDPSVQPYAQFDPSTKMYNLMPALGGIAKQPDVTAGNPAGNSQLTRILYDPQHPEKGLQAYWRDFKYDAKGNIQLDEQTKKPVFDPVEKSKTYAPEEIAPWLERMANTIPEAKKRRDFIKYIRSNKIHIPTKQPAPSSTSMGNLLDTLHGLLGNNNA